MAVAPAASTQDAVEPGVLEELRLPAAWPTSTGEGVVIAVLDGPGERTAAVRTAAAAAPDAEVVPVDVVDDDGVSAADVATGIAEAAEDGVGVIALTLGGRPEASQALADETVRRALRAAVESGAAVVVPEPDDALPEDVPLVLVATGTPEGSTAVGGDPAAVAGAAALLVAQGRTPQEITDLLVANARGDDRTVDAAAAVEQAANLGAGGTQAAAPEDSEGALSPALVGAIAVGLALTVVGGAIALGARRPRQG
ncbi:MAG TPA: S8 family serine peptidase [Acidimicrobiales bacterium]|nr:S8 family serine peptidase [Acidimicrobiales bacterium]